MALRVAAALIAVLLLSGCIDESRVNSECRWTDSVSGPVDLTTRAGREHLRVDVEIANELMVRYGDVYGRNRPDLQRPHRAQCERDLTDTIMARHAVTRGQIKAAERDRVWWVDILAVFLPMSVLAVAATDYTTRRVIRSFDPEDRLIAGCVSGVLALLGAGLTLAVTNFWAFNVEGWRLRNEHVSHRAFLVPLVTHPYVCAAVAIVLCVATAIVRFRRADFPHGHSMRAGRPAILRS